MACQKGLISVPPAPRSSRLWLAGLCLAGLPLILATSGSRLALAQESAGPPGPTVRVLVWEAAQLPLAALDRPLRLGAADAGSCGAGNAPGSAAGIAAGNTAGNTGAGRVAGDSADSGSLVLAAGQLARLGLERGQLVVEGPQGRRTLPAAACYWLTYEAPPASVESPAGPPGSARGGWTGWAAPEAAGAPLGGVPAAGWAASAGGDLQLGERRYRGQLQILASGSGLRAINHLPLEQYLASVVGSEMPASWPQAALRAQAVAARTYVLRQRKPGGLFDVTATTASQVYRGVEAETASTREAVAATRAQVLLFEGSLVEAVFHSSSGGVSTENSGEIWNQQLPYLVSVPDLDDVSPVQNWRQTLAPELLRKAFGEIGGALSIEVLSTSASGRIRQARVTGPAGTLLLSGTQLRSRLGLRSTLVHFEILTPNPAANKGMDAAVLPAWAMVPATAKVPDTAKVPATAKFRAGSNIGAGFDPSSGSSPSRNPGAGSGIGANIPIAGGAASSGSRAVNYRSIFSGSATAGALAAAAAGSSTGGNLAISPVTTSPGAGVAGATGYGAIGYGQGSSGGASPSPVNSVPVNSAPVNSAAASYVPGMAAAASLARLLPPPPLLPAIQSDSLQLTQPTLLAIGRGFGHGVGMSQWGAYGLARRGEDYQRILLHYYRGSQLRPYAAALVSP